MLRINRSLNEGEIQYRCSVVQRHAACRGAVLAELQASNDDLNLSGQVCSLLERRKSNPKVPVSKVAVSQWPVQSFGQKGARKMVRLAKRRRDSGCCKVPPATRHSHAAHPGAVCQHVHSGNVPCLSLLPTAARPPTSLYTSKG